jgi:phosphatidate cytidylyltransferase
VLRLRFLSAIVGVPILLLIAVVGGWWYVAAVAVGAIIAAREVFGMLRAAGYHPTVPLGIALTVAIALDALATDVRIMPGILVLGMLASIFVVMARADTAGALVDWALTLAPAAYVGGTMHYLIALRMVPQGLLWIMLVLICSWACDITAFFVGRRWGRVRLAPRISPAKTVEGAIGGLIGAVLTAVVVGLVAAWLTAAVGFDPGGPVGALHLAGLGLVIGACAIAGDLVESFIKRQCGAKDSGNLIPGHGGVLDRIDSWLLAAIGAYFYMVATL